MATTTRRSRTMWLTCLGTLVAAGCGAPGSEYGDDRATAYATYGEALTAFDAKDYATAEPKLAAAIEPRLLNPDVYCEAVVRLAVCWGATGKYAEALAELDTLGSQAPNQAEIFAARAFILGKQGKAADARMALAKARQINRTIQEFK
jgi:tetratricopeptide (TPR) repeat protein